MRRVLRALHFAQDAVDALLSEACPVESRPPAEKFVAETALLLYNVAALAEEDGRVAAAIRKVARAIAPIARSEEVRTAICLDPGQALDHGCAHILLTAIGDREDALDELLRASLSVRSAPERLPHRLLEQDWLRRLTARTSDSGELAAPPIEGSMLSRPIDAFQAGRFDFYAFTHAVMYATDFGMAPLAVGPDAEANAIAGLAFAIRTLDYDIAAELLMTWPMLRLEWSPPAATVFEWLARAEDHHGVLPGKSFEKARDGALRGFERKTYRFATCYHTVYVTAFLWACVLRFDRFPAYLVEHLDERFGPDSQSRPHSTPAAYELAFGTVDGLSDQKQIKALGPLLLTIALREAVQDGDIRGLRAALQLALDRDLTHVLAVRQGADLLRRLPLLEKCS